MADNVYGDLQTVDLGTEVIKLQERNEQLLEHIKLLEKDVARLCSEVTDMKKIQRNLTTNISELFKTAKIELERKDKIIADLRSEIDDLVFKRRDRRAVTDGKRSADENIIGNGSKRVKTESHSDVGGDAKRCNSDNERCSKSHHADSKYRRERERSYDYKRKHDERRRSYSRSYCRKRSRSRSISRAERERKGRTSKSAEVKRNFEEKSSSKSRDLPKTVNGTKEEAVARFSSRSLSHTEVEKKERTSKPVEVKPNLEDKSNTCISDSPKTVSSEEECIVRVSRRSLSHTEEKKKERTSKPVEVKSNLEDKSNTCISDSPKTVSSAEECVVRVSSRSLVHTEGEQKERTSKPVQVKPNLEETSNTKISESPITVDLTAEDTVARVSSGGPKRRRCVVTIKN